MGSIRGVSTPNPYYIFLYKVKRKGICSHYPLERHLCLRECDARAVRGDTLPVLRRDP